MHLDVKTLGFAWALLMVLVGLLSFLLWSTGLMYPGFGRWTLARATAVFTIAAVYFPQATPLWLQPPTVALGILTPLLILEAFREFLGYPPGSRVVRAAATVAIAAGILLRFAASQEAARADSLIAIGVLSWAVVVTLVPALQRKPGMGVVITAISAVIYGGIYLGRGIYDLFIPADTDLFFSGPFSVAFVVGLIVTTLASSFGFILMHYERLIRDRRRSRRSDRRRQSRAHRFEGRPRGNRPTANRRPGGGAKTR